MIASACRWTILPRYIVTRSMSGTARRRLLPGCWAIFRLTVSADH
jgi:hypothetical protein